MNDNQAKKIILYYRDRKLKQGITKLCVLDFHFDKIKLPPPQISRIMDKLFKEC